MVYEWRVWNFVSQWRRARRMFAVCLCWIAVDMRMNSNDRNSQKEAELITNLYRLTSTSNAHGILRDIKPPNSSNRGSSVNKEHPIEHSLWYFFVPCTTICNTTSVPDKDRTFCRDKEATCSSFSWHSVDLYDYRLFKNEVKSCRRVRPGYSQYITRYSTVATLHNLEWVRWYILIVPKALWMISAVTFSSLLSINQSVPQYMFPTLYRG